MDASMAGANAPPRRAAWSTWRDILLCSGYPSQLLIAQLLSIAGVRPLLPNGHLSGTFVVALSLVDAVVLLTLMIVLLRLRGESPLRVFVGDRPPSAEVAAGMLSLPMILFMVIAVTVAIRQFAPALHTVPDNPLEGLVGDGHSRWLFLVVVIVAGGVREELQRAFLLHRFRADLGQPWVGLLITSVAFGMGHTLQGLDAAVITGVLGAIWGAMYLTRGGALAPMVSHSLFNSGELLRILLS